ncbi:MAG TPA: fibrobacter succinogenes major paralogous domain-containing protein [Prolixibacteraceae bacterium]|nr:fibrobacter succinogenes major paralogous domain-containing protein [Prolixibacteraceae bacterium]
MRRKNSIVLIFTGLFIIQTISCEKDEYSENQMSGLIYETVSDQEGNKYRTIQIGTQVWMAENLRTARFRDGSSIPVIQSGTMWESATKGAYCRYENNDTVAAAYGHLYNWYAVTDSRGLAPAGWHIPGEADWETLAGFLGGTGTAAMKLKEKGTRHWSSASPGATNESGFTALPGGARGEVGQYCFLGTAGFWWSSGFTNDRTADLRCVTNHSSRLFKYTYNKEYGFSVRCVKD